MTGATITPTGTPAAATARTAARRAAGCAARGSISPARRPASVVTDRDTAAAVVGVGDAGDAERPRLPPGGAQLAPQQGGGVLLDEDLRLEVQPRRQAEVFMGRARVAVDTTVLASSIGVYAGVEADVGAVI